LEKKRQYNGNFVLFSWNVDLVLIRKMLSSKMEKEEYKLEKEIITMKEDKRKENELVLEDIGRL